MALTTMASSVGALPIHTNTNGDFGLNVTIPTTTPGLHTIGATGRSGAFAATNYSVISRTTLLKEKVAT